MDNTIDTTTDEIREFYGIADEGNIVSTADLEETEVIEWPEHMKK